MKKRVGGRKITNEGKICREVKPSINKMDWNKVEENKL